MTRTTKALKRLGVATIAVATIGAGAPAFFATAASASHVSGVTLSPKAVIAATSVCTPYTVSVAPAQVTIVDVQISQATTNTGATPAGTPAGVQFCSLTNTPAAAAGPNPQGAPTQTTSTAPSGTGAGTVNPAGNNGVYFNNGPACTNTTPGQGGQVVGATTASGTTTRSTCDAEFTTNSNGQVTVGILSTNTGAIDITAFVEEPNVSPSNNAPNQTGNNVPNVGEPQDAGNLFVVSDPQAATTKVTCARNSAQANTNTTIDFVCTAFGDNPNTGSAGVGTVPVYGAQLSYVVPNGPDANQTPTPCNTSSYGDPTLSVSTPGRTNARGLSVCSIRNLGTPGTDNVVIYAEKNNQAGAQTTEPQAPVTAQFIGEARTITCGPKTASNPLGTEHQITCNLRDVLGNPVPSNAGGNNNNFSNYVRFLLSGTGRIVNNNCTTNGGLNNTGNVCYIATDLNGDARLFIRSDQSGQSTVQADVYNGAGNNTGLASQDPNSECNQAAGQTRSGVNATGKPAGNCTDTVQKFWGTATPGPQPTGTGTPAPTGTASPAPTGTGTPAPTSTGTASPGPRVGLTLVTLDSDIPAGSTGRLVATGAANQAYELRCYTRPSTSYFTARTGSFDAMGDAVTFTLALGRNTRCFIQYVTNPAQGVSPSVVVNVHTVLSLSTVRTGTRTYVFQGRNLPRAAGQLITLYRVDNAGNEIRTTNLITDASGVYRVTRTFTGTGTFQFRVRTPNTNDNAAGVSNTITVRVF